MTPERLAEILASIDRGDTWDRTAVDLAREVRRLRALPVIATCGECGWRAVSRGEWACREPRSVLLAARTGKRSLVSVDAAPPPWCPLRGGVR